ncbi:recombinase family protein [Peribacillus kribbensis]|uniref:recombinase family protein n=1 Tax=Peribacillus kribbensis TaxID=356658 RepID=UPI000412952A|nr:recombinase family protein [Peribacillus kribbensis]
MKKTVIYIRQSLEKDKQKYSLEVQKSTCLTTAKRNNWMVDSIYNEGFLSARKTPLYDRPWLKRLLEDVKAGMIARIIVYKRDRLARNVEQYLEIIQILQDHQVQLCFSADNEPPLFHGPVGELVETLLAGLAQHEAENIVKRLITSRKDLVLKGKRAGGKPPFGYQVNKGDLSIDEEHKAIIRRIYQIVIDFKGFTLKDLNNEIKNDPLLCEYDLNAKSVIPRELHIGRLVQNFEGERYEYPGVLEDLKVVNEEEWTEANRKLTVLLPKYKEKREKYNALLKGRVHCWKCTERVKAGTSLYSCPKKHIKVDMKSMDDEVISAALIQLEKILVLDKEIQTNIRNFLSEKHSRPERRNLSDLESAVEKTKKDIKDLLSICVSHGVREKELSDLVYSYKEQIGRINRSKRKLFLIEEKMNMLKFDEIVNWIKEGKSETLTPFLLKMIKSVILQPDGIDVIYSEFFKGEVLLEKYK